MTTLPSNNNTPGRGGFLRDMGLGTGLLPTGDSVGDDVKPFDGSQKPPQGSQTSRQAVGFAGIGFAQLPGFTQPMPGTYANYRRMNAHPTLALCYSIVTAPILAGSWSYEVRRPDGKATKQGPRIGDGVKTDPIDRQLADRASTIQRMFDATRSAFLWEAVRSLQFGWRPFEKVWELRPDGTWWLTKLKGLLPDFTWVYVDSKGNYAGVTQMNADLGPAKSMVITHDGEAGNYYGRSRHENAREIWSRWLQLDDKSGQLATKAAAIIPQVHYPVGEGTDANGQPIDNYQVAVQMLNGLSTGRGVAIPNSYARTDDARASAELAGKSAWMIDFLEASGAAANLAGMTDRQRYYDQLLFSAWMRSPRTGMEAVTSGSRADSESHADTGMTDSDLIHGDICEQLSQGAVNDVLALNWGADARDSVFVRPAPLQDEKKKVLTDLFTAICANPATLPEAIRNINMQNVFDVLELPESAGGVKFDDAAMTPQPPADAMPGDAKKNPAAGKNAAGGKVKEA